MNQLKTILLLGVLSAVVVGIGGLLGQEYLYLFGGLAVLMNFGAYFWSDKIVLKMHHAQEVTGRDAPRLHAMVEELAANADIPKPRVFVLPDPQPNAFATGRNPAHGAVAVTEGIMSLLSERELRGVLAHELAHIKNRDILIATIAAAMASIITYIANVLQFSAFFGGVHSDDEDGGSPIAAIAMAFVAPIAALLIQMAISRSREFQADATGAQLCGDPEALARALQKLDYGASRVPSHATPATASLFIVSPLTGTQSLMNLFSTHPNMEERIRRLRAMSLRRPNAGRPLISGFGF